VNLRQLDLFVAVAESRSFSRGAAICCLTQSTVSQHIATLEEEVNTRLFDRTRQGALLTPGGKIFLRHARRILVERDQLFQEMAAFNGESGGELRIGASNIPATYLIPPLLPKLAESYSGISVNMLSGDSQEIIGRLLNAEIELAVIGAAPEHRKLESVALASDVLVLIVGAGHRWSGREMVSLDELASEPLIAREHGSGSEQALQEELRRLNYKLDSLQIAARLGSNEAVRQVVAGGFGCAFVSERSVQQELESGVLLRVAVAGMIVEREFWLARLKGRTPSPAARVFSELLFQTYNPEGTF